MNHLCTRLLPPLLLPLLLGTPAAWGAAARGQRPPPVELFDFEADDSLTGWSGDAGINLKRVDQHAVQGRFALRISFPPYDPKGPAWLVVRRRMNPPANWSSYGRLELEVFNPQSFALDCSLAIGPRPRAYALPPQKSTTISLPLADAQSVAELQLLVRQKHLRLEKPTALFIDQVRLYPKTLDDPGVFEVLLGPGAGGGRLLASVPRSDLPVQVRVENYPGQLAIRQVVARLGGSTKTALLEDGRTSFSFPPPPGDATLTVELLDPAGSVVTRRTLTLDVLPPRSDEVGFDAAGHCRINGRLFFPLCMANADVPHFALLKAAGFNAVGPSLEAKGEVVAEARRNGLRLVCGVATDRLIADVSAARDTGAVLGYHLADEPEPGRLRPAELAARRRTVTQADPYHPTLASYNDAFADYAGATDVMIANSYPIPGPLAPMAERLRRAAGASAGRGPLWSTVQLFGWQAYCLGPEPTRRGGRPPTYDELRAMCWLSIALGAQGLVFYSDSVQENSTRLAWPILWQGLEATLAELTALENLLLAQPVSIMAKPATACAAGRRLNDDLLLIAVNTADARQGVTLESIPATRVIDLESQRTLEVHAGVLSDELPPRSVRLYATRTLDLPLPDVAATRQRLAQLQRAQDEYYARDVALHERGARVEASWGLPPHPKAAAWRRIIDGYRGTSWTVGTPGYFLSRDGARWPSEETQRGKRWLEVRLARPTPLERIVIVSANVEYELLAGLGEQLSPVPLKRSKTREYHPQETCDRAEALFARPTPCDRLRLRFTRDALPKRPELLFEIEAIESPVAK